MKRIVRLNVLRHQDVCSFPYDVFSAVVETRRWGFGFRVHNWRDRWPAPNEWGLRVQFGPWHLCFGLSRANAPAHLPPASGGKVPPVVGKSDSKGNEHE